ncbi:MAG: BON domain-containing protein [Rhodospirillales bacterium]|nr:BON domain-containing protein [Rhodospirillales bacterium]
MIRISDRSRTQSIAAIAAIIAILPGLAGCVGAVVGAGAVATSAAVQERGLKGGIDDTVIRARINSLWLDHDVDMYRLVSLSVVEGRVLLTGQVRLPQMRIDAVRLTWKAKGVREVINEIKVTDEGGIVSYARDSWISTQLKSRLLFDKKILSINYSIETVNGAVYLMGIAQNQAELDRITNHARTLRYVKRVVSYVQLKDDPRRHKS